MSQISGACSLTINILLSVRLQFILLTAKKHLLTRSASNNWLDILNICQATWTNGNKESLIDHRLTTKNQIFHTIVLEQITENDHFSHLFYRLWNWMMREV